MEPLEKQDARVEKKRRDLHRWEHVVQTTIWLIDHDVPQLIIKLILWILPFFLRW